MPYEIRVPKNRKQIAQETRPGGLNKSLGGSLIPQEPVTLGTDTDLLPGQLVCWDSPLFGYLEAVALAVSEKAVTVFHPLSEQEVPLPRHWVKPMEN